eukprot:962670-Rhodomonas_salina.1
MCQLVPRKLEEDLDSRLQFLPDFQLPAVGLLYFVPTLPLKGQHGIPNAFQFLDALAEGQDKTGCRMITCELGVDLAEA